MKAAILTKRFITCPRCTDGTWEMDHLAPGTSWGPWSCPNSSCTAAVKGTVGTDSTIDIEVFDKPEMVLALFQLRGLYLVITSYAQSSNYDYFFHSHQCPTNMLQHTLAVFDPETGIDPHGVLRFVAAMPDSKGVREMIERNLETSLAGLFAIFGTDGTPIASDWPERNGGKLPWLAKMQRDEQTKGEA